MDLNTIERNDIDAAAEAMAAPAVATRKVFIKTYVCPMNV